MAFCSLLELIAPVTLGTRARPATSLPPGSCHHPFLSRPLPPFLGSLQLKDEITVKWEVAYAMQVDRQRRPPPPTHLWTPRGGGRRSGLVWGPGGGGSMTGKGDLYPRRGLVITTENSEDKLKTTQQWNCFHARCYRTAEFWTCLPAAFLPLFLKFSKKARERNPVRCGGFIPMCFRVVYF